jgi:hypothetical protein
MNDFSEEFVSGELIVGQNQMTWSWLGKINARQLECCELRRPAPTDLVLWPICGPISHSARSRKLTANWLVHFSL